MRSQDTPLAVLINDYRVACEAKLSPRSVVVNDRLMAAVVKAFSSWLWKTGKTKEHRLAQVLVEIFGEQPHPPMRPCLFTIADDDFAALLERVVDKFREQT